MCLYVEVDINADIPLANYFIVYIRIYMYAKYVIYIILYSRLNV